MNKKSKTAPHSGKPQVVFFGTGPVAARSLELLAKDFEVEAVITKPKPEHHRGDAPVLELSTKLGLKVLTASNKTELSALFSKKPVKSTLGIVIDYGVIINQDVIDYFPLGIINSHFSLLPEWRGADPITFSVLSGQQVTGVSLMVITAGLDEGPLLSQAPYLLPPDITTPVLTDTLIEISHASLTEIIPGYICGEIVPRPQDLTNKPTYSRKLTKEDGVINWKKPAEVLEREIRAFIDWPKSRTQFGGKDIIITKAHAELSQVPHTLPGYTEAVSNQGVILVTTGSGSLAIERLKPSGKKEMPTKAFLAGYKRLLDKS